MIREETRFSSSPYFEGMVSVRALIEARQKGIHDRKIETVLYDKNRAEKNEKELAWLRHRAEEMGFTIELSDRETLDSLAVGSSHGGVIAKAGERTFPPLSEEAVRGGKFFLMAEGIEDPYNFGYALRSLYAAGVDGIVLSPRSWMSAAGVVCRASAGASELLPMYVSDGESAAELFKKCGYRVAAADLRDSVSCFEADLSFPLFVLVGGEKRGISRALFDKTDLRVRIDYARPFDASLSAASAATVIGYEVFRQNRGKA